MAGRDDKILQKPPTRLRPSGRYVASMSPDSKYSTSSGLNKFHRMRECAPAVSIFNDTSVAQTTTPIPLKSTPPAEKENHIPLFSVLSRTNSRVAFSKDEITFILLADSFGVKCAKQLASKFHWRVRRSLATLAPSAGTPCVTPKEGKRPTVRNYTPGNSVVDQT